MSFDSLLGAGSAGRQLLVYGVGYEVARALLGPMFTEIEYLINNNSPIMELSPPEIADLVVRGAIGSTLGTFDGEAEAAARAQKYGIDAARFHEMLLLAGQPPGLIQVLEWARRGFLPFDGPTGSPSVAEAIRTSRIYSYWTDTILKSQFVPPAPADAVNAVLRNQITEAEGVAMAYFGGLGVNALSVPAGADTSDTETAFTVLLNSRGNPPSLGELLELARRGIIAWGNLDPATKTPNPAEISFAQGIFEGDSKDKWLPYYAKLAVYLPPPRTITTLLKEGVISTTEATTLFEAAGLDPTLADAYIASATTQKTAAHKNLNESAILELYVDKLIDQPTAEQYLELLGYDPAEAALMLTTATAKAEQALLNKNINRIATYYIGHKISDTVASTELAALGLPAAQVSQYLTSWNIDRTANVRILSEAQIVDAWEYGIFTQDQAQTELGYLGYTPYDAWVLLSIKNKQPLANPPPQGPAPVQ